MVFVWGNVVGQVRINEIRADDDGPDDAEFIELIGIAGTDLTGYEIVHVNGNGGGNIFTHIIGSFTIPDDGFLDSESNAIGFYVLGVGEFSTGPDETTESTSSVLQNGPDGIILYDNEGNVIDAVAWSGAGDINGDVTTSGAPTADNYLHVTSSDQGNDNSLQAPNDVVGDDGSGWDVLTSTIGSINTGQTSGSIILSSTLKNEPANHTTSFTANGSINSVNISWTDATGSPTPDAYLIKMSDSGFGSLSDPTDTHPEPNDFDFSDGSGALNVNYGVESASFSGLDEITTYYFKIFPYTNTGSDIDYKTDGTVPQDDATTLETPDIILNEFLADPDGDSNGDEISSTDDDEFLEFVNTGSTNLDISGWTVEDANGTTHTFDNPTVLKPSQAIIIFGGGTPTGDFGGAIIQTTGSLSLNNTGDDIILKNGAGLEVLSYTYGSEANNDVSITRSPDLTGNFSDHTSADTEDGSAFSPGTRIDGFPFHAWVKLAGNEGWRMLSTPTSDNSYDNLLETIWTQGSSGAKHSGGEPNVVIFDGLSFHAVDDLTSNMTAGQGFLVFVYHDDDFDPGTSDSFPKILEMSGTENTGTITPSINSGASDSATLVGNPYLSPIDWDLLTKNNLSNTVYVYDDSYGIPGGDDVSAAGVAGSYRVWNGSSGSLTDGRIAPFQGFWVIYDGSGTPSLTIEESDKTVGGTFYKNKNEKPVTIHLKAETERMFNEAFFSFTKNGSIGMDNFDGLELTPLDHGDYLSLATETEGTLLDINNLPLEFSETIEVPLHVNVYQAIEEGWKTMSSEVTVSWPELQNIPPEWRVTLIDKQAGNTINLKETDSYTFLLKDNVKKITDLKPFHPHLNNAIQREKSPQGNRFILSIDPASETPIVNNIPDQFALKQNYPNPFNPITNIKYEIASPTEVELNVYNVLGQRIATLVNENKAPGAYEVTWDATDMASGIYYYHLKVNGIVFTRQMALIK